MNLAEHTKETKCPNKRQSVMCFSTEEGKKEVIISFNVVIIKF